MKQNVQAGTIDNLKKALKSISDKLFNFLDKMLELGIEITKQEEGENGSVKMSGKYGDKPIDTMIEPIVDDSGESTGKVNIYVKYNNRTEKLENIDESQADKKLNELLKKVGVDTSETADSSRKLQVTLQKVNATKESRIELTAIKANYNIKAANEALGMILDNDEFFDAITEEPVSFEIIDKDDDFDICSIPDIDLSGVCTDIARAALQAWCKFSNLTWNSIEPVPPEIFDIRYCLMNNIDFFAELGANPIQVNPFAYDDVEFDVEFDIDLTCAMQDLNYYLTMLDTYQIDFPVDIQDEISFMIEELEGLQNCLSIAPEPLPEPEGEYVFRE